MHSSPGRSIVLSVTVVALVSSAGVAGGLVAPASTATSAQPALLGPGSSSPLSVAASSHANDTLEVRTMARPPTPGSASNHFIRVTLPASSNVSSLHAVELDYGGTGATLDSDMSLLRATVFVAENGNRTRMDLENASLAIGNDSVMVTVPASYPIKPGDEVSVAIKGVQNPPERGQIAIDVALNPTRDGPTGTGTIDVRVPAPTINPQGVVGDRTRIGVHDPLGARGFVVAYGPEGKVIGTKALDPEKNLRMDLGLGSFVDDQYERNGMTVRLAAHRDSDGDGTFELGVDDQFQRDGEPVEATVEDAVFAGGMTTTTTTTTVTCPTVGFWYEAQDPIRNGTARVDYGIRPDWRGFVVVETLNGTVLGHTDLLAYEVSVNADGAPIPLDTVPNEERDVRVVAYTDVDGNGAFDPAIDERCGAGDVSENQFGATTAGTSVPVDGTSNPTETTSPGLGVVVTVVGLVLGGLWYRTR